MIKQYSYKVIFIILLVYSFEAWGDAEIIDELGGDSDPLMHAKESDLGSSMTRKPNLMRTQEAYDNSDERSNVVMFDWAPGKTFKVRMRELMSTLIHLPKGEKVASMILGDKDGFAVKALREEDEALGHLVQCESLFAGIDTNLMVVGESGKLYQFYLRSDPIDSKHVSDYTVYIHTKNPLLVTLSEKEKETSTVDYLKTLPETSERNTAYRMYGDAVVAPKAVFDDGRWTYFDFRDHKERHPIVFKVVDQRDMVVNTRTEDGFLIAMSISREGWTLRNGDKTVCIKPSAKASKPRGLFG